MNSRFSLDAARSFVERGTELDLTSLPKVPLKDINDDQRLAVAELGQPDGRLARGRHMRGTGVLHKKRTASSGIEPTRSRIQLFDMIWWMHFRNLEFVRPTFPPMSQGRTSWPIEGYES